MGRWGFLLTSLQEWEGSDWVILCYFSISAYKLTKTQLVYIWYWFKYMFIMATNEVDWTCWIMSSFDYNLPNTMDSTLQSTDIINPPSRITCLLTDYIKETYAHGLKSQSWEKTCNLHLNALMQKFSVCNQNKHKNWYFVKGSRSSNDISAWLIKDHEKTKTPRWGEWVYLKKIRVLINSCTQTINY